ncbi:MAG: TolC family protein [Syntrophales bacterium]|nr:TolC family protein [Syntrophales bacterium]
MTFKWFVKAGVLPLLMLTSLSAAAFSAEEPDFLHLTLKESINLALERSLAVSSARAGVEGAESSRKEARTAYFPAFNTAYSYTRLNEKPEAPVLPGFRSIEAGTRDNFIWELEVAQPLFTGGEITNTYKIAKLGVEISREEKNTAILDSALEVKEGYFNILKAKNVLQVAKQSVEQLRAHRNIAQSFFDVGIIPKNDLLQAEVELANGVQNLVTAENALELAKARFNTILRRDINAELEVEDILSYHVFEKELEECLDVAFRRRPEISVYGLQLEQTQRAVDVAKSNYYPRLSVLGNYSRYGDDAEVNGGTFVEEEDWYFLAVANWSFWEWGRTKYNVSAAKSRTIRAGNALTNVKDLIALEVKNFYLNLRNTEKRIFVTEKAIAQAEENYRINEERYREQVGTTTDVIDAQTLLTRTKSDYYNALSDYNIAWGRLQRSMGIVWGEPGSGK